MRGATPIFMRKSNNAHTSNSTNAAAMSTVASQEKQVKISFKDLVENYLNRRIKFLV
jgi:hypothetical protein